jgi:hypothetical protein
MKKNILLLLISTLLNLPVKAAIHTVPGNFATIQDALNACAPFDTVVVQPGAYFENLTWPSVNGIKLFGSSSANTVVNGGGSNRCLNISASVIDTLTIVKGLTFLGGGIATGSGYGAGAYLNNASVIFDDVVITGNRVYVPGGHGYGAGVHLNNSSSVFRNCTISFNGIDSATWCYGAGIYISGGSPILENVEISDNSMSAENWTYGIGMHIKSNATVKMDRVKVINNFSGDNAIWYYGNGIYVDDSDVTATNLLVADNFSGLGGSFNYGGGIFCDGVSTVELIHTTIANNYKTNSGTINGTGIYARDASVEVVNSISYNPGGGAEVNTGGGGSVAITYSNVRNGYTGTGNISALSQFAGPTDYHLLLASPCAGTGTPSNSIGWDLDYLPRPQPANSDPDMGCYELNQTPTGLSDLNQETMNIYPNPTAHTLTVSVQQTDHHIITVSDLRGRILQREEFEGKMIMMQVDHIPSGIYMVDVDGKWKNKVVIER